MELGPEPIKTKKIINELNKKVNILGYIGIDINCSSYNEMKKEIGELISVDKFHYLIRDYREINRLNVFNELNIKDDGNTVVLVTSLGSQEGNEHPEKMHNVYHNFLRNKDDILLTELQLCSPFN